MSYLMGKGVLGQDSERACKLSDRGDSRLKNLRMGPLCGGAEARGPPADGLGDVRTRAPRVPFLTPQWGVWVGKGLTLYPPQGFRDFPCMDTYPSVRPARASPGLSGPLLRQRPSQLGYGHITGRHGCVRCVATKLSVCRCWTELFRRWPHLVLEWVIHLGRSSAHHARYLVMA